MGTRRTLRASLEFDVKGEEELRGLSSELRNVADTSKRAGREMGELETRTQRNTRETENFKLGLARAGAVLTAVGIAAAATYKVLGEGADLQAAREKFDNLASSIDTTSESMLINLREATRGMVSDAELIQGASDIISLGLADTEEQTVRLATAVSTLGLDMQQVILTFANNSTARLDALGLSIEDVTTKAAELEAQGFVGDAFDEAVLIALENKMTLFGDASLTAAGKLDRLEAKAANLTDTMKLLVLEGLEPAIDALLGLPSDVEKNFIDANELAKQADSLDEYIELLNEAGLFVPDRETARIWFEQGQAIEMAAESASLLEEKYERAANATSGLDAETRKLAESVAGSDAVMLQNAQTFELASVNYAKLRDGIEAARPEIRKSAEVFGELWPPIERSSRELEKLLGQMNALDGRSVSATVEVRTIGDLGDLGIGTTGGGKGAGLSGAKGTSTATQGLKPSIGAASGLSDFIVPSGFPNDSFLMGLTSGETVNVTPAGETVNNNSNVSIIQNINGGPDTAAQARDGVMEALTASGLKGFG